MTVQYESNKDEHRISSVESKSVERCVLWMYSARSAAAIGVGGRARERLLGGGGAARAAHGEAHRERAAKALRLLVRRTFSDLFLSVMKFFQYF